MDDTQLIPLAHERALTITKQDAAGLLQGDVSQSVAVLLAKAVVALTKLLQADVDEIAGLQTRAQELEAERNSYLLQLRAARDEQLMQGWYWTTGDAEARLVDDRTMCRYENGRIRAVGQIPVRVERAVRARGIRVKAESLKKSSAAPASDTTPPV